MAISASQAANIFIRKGKEAGAPLTQLQVQKLIYFFHGWGYPLCGERLVAEEPEAWKLGPVYKNAYDALRHNDANGILEEIQDAEGPSLLDENEDAKKLADAVYRVYGRRDGLELSWLTHQEGTPWHEIYINQNMRNKNRIPEELIKNHFVDANSEYQQKRQNGAG